MEDLKTKTKNLKRLKNNLKIYQIFSQNIIMLLAQKRSHNGNLALAQSALNSLFEGAGAHNAAERAIPISCHSEEQRTLARNDTLSEEIPHGTTPAFR